MNSLYLILDLATLAVPLLLSFDRKVAYYRKWKWLFPSILVMAAIFLIWDIVFAANGIWGFNEAYLVGLSAFGLPLEEWLFFLVVPYSCLFIYESLKAWFPGFNPLQKLSRWMAGSFAVLLLVLAAIHLDRTYTLVNFCFAAVLLLGMFAFNPKWGGRFWLSFAIALGPFFLMNGILTGSFLPEPIVWYSSEAIMGPRMWTIPVEDTAYAFSMLVIPTALLELLMARSKSPLRENEVTTAKSGEQIPITS